MKFNFVLPLILFSSFAGVSGANAASVTQRDLSYSITFPGGLDLSDNAILRDVDAT